MAGGLMEIIDTYYPYCHGWAYNPEYEKQKKKEDDEIKFLMKKKELYLKYKEKMCDLKNARYKVCD